MHLGSRCVAIAVVLLTLAASSAAAQGDERVRASTLTAFRGSGMWVSLYDTPAWQNPERVVARLSAHHVRTLYLETGNDRQHVDVVRPDRVARFLDAAHAQGIAVVGWYLPSLVDNRRDVRRAIAGASFVASSGSRFDAFALDVESTKVRSIPLRTRRAVAFAAAVRRGLPPSYPLGAITPDPVGARYWPAYPFGALAQSIDVFLPMAYFTARTDGAARVRSYSAANVVEIRHLVGDATFPIHPIGGETRHATLPELRAFLAASTATGALGASFWEYGATTPAQWAVLARAA